MENQPRLATAAQSLSTVPPHMLPETLGQLDLHWRLTHHSAVPRRFVALALDRAFAARLAGDPLMTDTCLMALTADALRLHPDTVSDARATWYCRTIAEWLRTPAEAQPRTRAKILLATDLHPYLPDPTPYLTTLTSTHFPSHP